MKILRKEFVHPSGEYAKDLWWWDKGDKKKTWVPYSMDEVRQQVMDFVNQLGPDKLVNICEHTTMKKKPGDDKVTHFVVWYWSEE